MGQRFGIEVQLSSDDFPVSAEEAKDGKLGISGVQNCGAGTATAYVSPYGEVLPCSSIPQIVFGNIRNDSFMRIWTGSTAMWFRKMAASSNERLICQAPCFRHVAEQICHL
ncbi:SPASM domain-containing protein [Methanofollis fontis]|nr:SPASM domain-containing protein [Methanofollis fontis]